MKRARQVGVSGAEALAKFSREHGKSHEEIAGGLECVASAGDHLADVHGFTDARAMAEGCREVAARHAEAARVSSGVATNSYRVGWDRSFGKAAQA